MHLCEKNWDDDDAYVRMKVMRHFKSTYNVGITMNNSPLTISQMVGVICEWMISWAFCMVSFQILSTHCHTNVLADITFTRHDLFLVKNKNKHKGHKHMTIP